jgi:thymidylate synthase
MPELNVLTSAEAAYWAGALALEGQPCSPRGIPTREVQNVTIHVRHPLVGTPYLEGRAARPAIGAVEACQLVGQTNDPERMGDVSEALMAFADGGIFHGAYGARVHGQIGPVVAALDNDIATRQAVMTIYEGPRDLGAPVRDIPCTLTLQFMWDHRRLALNLRTSMRSNDVWLGLPYDLAQFIALQAAVADGMRVPVGTYTHTVGSLHIYESDVAKWGAVRAPSEPPSHLTHYTEPMWGGLDVADNSARARAILRGRLITNPTPYETTLMEALA